MVHSDLESLENKKQFEEARKIRHSNLQSFDKKYLAPLWRQEGFDLLYRIKDYPKSLKAFENAIETMELNSALYGVASPLDIYYGATMAAISANKKKRCSGLLHRIQKTLFQVFTKPKTPKCYEAL